MKTDQNLGTASVDSTRAITRGDKQVLHIILPRIESMITGVWRILKAHDLVTLEYVDGSRESATISQDKWAKIHGSTFSIVSEVQSKR